MGGRDFLLLFWSTWPAARDGEGVNVNGRWGPGVSDTAGDTAGDTADKRLAASGALSDIEDEPVTVGEEKDGLSVAVQVAATALRLGLELELQLPVATP